MVFPTSRISCKNSQLFLLINRFLNDDGLAIVSATASVAESLPTAVPVALTDTLSAAFAVVLSDIVALTIVVGVNKPLATSVGRSCGIIVADAVIVTVDKGLSSCGLICR